MSNKRVLQASVHGSKPLGTAIVGDPLEIRRLLTRASNGQISASLKLRGNETVLKTHILAADSKTGLELGFKDAEGMLNAESFEKLIEGTNERECMVLIYLEGRFILGVTSEPTELLKDRMLVAPPSKVFKIQRRKDVRFTIPAAYEYTIEFDSLEQARTRVRKRIVDISESGLSFFVLSPREAGLFRSGMIIQRCFISIHNQRIPVMLKIRNRGRQERGSQGAGNKVGAEFEQIAPEDRSYIAQLVYAHAQHLFY